MPKRRKAPPRAWWATINPEGEIISTYPSLQEARDDAVGPVFRNCRFVRYRRDTSIRVEEPKLEGD